MDFQQSVSLRLDGGDVNVMSVDQAQQVLADQWPAEPGPRHRDATETCLKVIDGHRSTIDAQNALIEAALEAGILIE